MKQEHKCAQVLRWIADGEEIQWQSSNGTWCEEEHGDALSSIAMDQYAPARYRLKPRTITVNGREIVAGESEKPDHGATYWVPCLDKEVFFTEYVWNKDGDPVDTRCLQYGLVHLTKEAAIAHAKAMLNID